MADVELQKRWNVTRWHLNEARRLLPANAVQNAGAIADQDVATLAAFHDTFEHNELELALDQLEGLGALNNCRGGFWRYLEKAAQVMGLQERSAILRRRIEDAPDR